MLQPGMSVRALVLLGLVAVCLVCRFDAATQGGARFDRTQSAGAAPDASQAVIFSCPMDPDVRSHDRGKCRRCGMQLVAGVPDPIEFHVLFEPSMAKMGRPKRLDDAEILAAARRAMIRKGPGRCTMAEISREAGVSAPTLMLRFGSRRGLLLALADSARDSVAECFVRVRSTHSSALHALIAAATEITKLHMSPEELMNQLVISHKEVRDPVVCATMQETSARVRKGYRKLLDEAVNKGELDQCDTARLARIVSAVAIGARVEWGIYRHGTSDDFVTADLEVLLERYRPARRLV